MSKFGRNLPVIVAPSSQQLLTTGVSTLSDAESGIQDFFGHPIITFFTLVSGDARKQCRSQLFSCTCAPAGRLYTEESELRL